MRWGFKAEAERIALKLRSELRLSALAPLDPRTLAELFEIPIIELSDLPGTPEQIAATEHFEGAGRELFSALLMRAGERWGILVNSTHSAERQNSSIAHELAHFILRHELKPAFAMGGCRNCDRDQEEEADWLGWTLLVPRQAAIAVLRRGLDERRAAKEFQVSIDVMRLRLNGSGAVAQMRNSGRGRRLSIR